MRGLYTTAESLLKRALRSDGLDASAYSEILLFLGMIAKKYGHLAEAETYHQQGLVLAQRNEDPLMEVRHLSRLGFLYTLRQHYNQAKSTFLEALEKARLVHDPLEVCTLMNGLVVVFKETASYVDAKQYIHEGLALARQYELNEREAVFLINWSTIESLQGNTSLAEHLAQQALALAEIHGLRENLTYLNNLLSELAMDRKNYEQAITFSSNCLILARQSGNVELIGASLATLGTAYGWLEEFEEARAYFQEAFTIITTSNFPLLLQETQLRCADMYILAGQEKQAQVLFQKLVEAEELDIRAGALFGLARIFTLWGDLQTAKKYAEQCLALSKAIGHEIVPIQQLLEQYRTE